MNASRRLVTATIDAEQAVSNLESLRSNKHYSCLAETIVYVHSFITNPLHSLRDGPQLLARITRQLFPEYAALSILG